MILYIPWSMMDQLRKGDELITVRTRNPTCPLAMLEPYLTWTKMQLNDQRFLFRPICKTGREESLRKLVSVNYSCLTELFKKKLRGLGCNPDDFQLHSSRVGGATAAANNGVSDRLFKCHGHGEPTRPRTAMWRTQLTTGWNWRSRLVCDCIL